MILFNEIFSKAVNLFDDPDIRFDYVNSPIGFAKRMLPFLMSGKKLFVSPTAIVDKLSIFDVPQGELEEITVEVGETPSDQFVLSTTPVQGSVFEYWIGTDRVKATYDYVTNTVTFPRVINVGETCSVEWYYAGAFTADFSTALRSDFPMNSIMESIENILAQGIVCAWDENEMNRALENRNILSDTDFSFYSPANSAKAKVDHHKQVLREMDTLISELNWRIMGTPQGGSRFGK